MKIENNSVTNTDKASEDLKRLNLELARAQESLKEDVISFDKSKSEALNTSANLVSQFVSAIFVGGIMGYGIDYWFKTTPFALIIGILFGFLAGMKLIITSAQAIQAKQPKGKDLPPEAEEEY